MQLVTHNYSEAVHYAAENLLVAYAHTQNTRLEKLNELLFSLGSTIPCNWSTYSRDVILHPNSTLDEILVALQFDLKMDASPQRYIILSSILQLALTVQEVRMAPFLTY